MVSQLARPSNAEINSPASFETFAETLNTG
jgi:hypothetical protein